MSPPRINLGWRVRKAIGTVPITRRNKAATSLLHISHWLGPCSARVVIDRSDSHAILASSAGSPLFSLVHSPLQLHRIVDIPLKYEGTRPRYASGRATMRNYGETGIAPRCTDSPVAGSPPRAHVLLFRDGGPFTAISPYLVWEFSDVGSALRKSGLRVYGRF